MNTTALVAEILVGGIQALVWVGLLTGALLGEYLGKDLGGGPFLGLGAPDPSVSRPLPIRIGPPLRSLPPVLVPEPDAPWLGGAACLTLAYLARRRRQRAAEATAETRHPAPEE